MTDDPFERAVQRAEAAERADKTDRARDQVAEIHRTVRGPLRRASAVGFRIHAAVFFAINVMLFVIWLTVTPASFPWFLFVFFGWGAGFLAHYAAVKDHVRERR